MARILDIPVPDLDQIIVGAQLVIILWPVRLLVQAMEKDLRKHRNRIIKEHVKTGHKSRLKLCIDGHCASLQNWDLLQSVVDSQPEVVAAESHQQHH